MKKGTRRKCLNCKVWIRPDYRNRRHQRYCSKPDCRKARHRSCQAKWVSKPENRDYFRCAENTQRVQAWRKRNPGYWKRRRPLSENALQDDCSVEVTENKLDRSASIILALQDDCQTQALVTLGLISQLSGTPLQDDIASQIRALVLLGRNISGIDPETNLKGENQYVDQTRDMSPANPAGAAPIQLDRSTAGAPQAPL